MLQSLHIADGLSPTEIHSKIAFAFLSLESRFSSRYCTHLIHEFNLLRPVTSFALYLIRIPKLPEADPFDLLCHIAFDAPVLTCKQRAERLRRRNADFFEQYGEDAKAILEILLNKYAEKGVEEFDIPTTFKANREFGKYGNVAEIAQRFGGVQQLKEAVNHLQSLLYTA